MKYFVFYLATAILFYSCGNSKPSPADVETDLATRISTESNGNLTLIDFKKSNATDSEFLGQKAYTIQFEATLQVEQDCFMYVNKSGSGPFFMSFETFSNKPEFIPSMQMQIVQANKGDKVPYSDAVTYLETEEGWVRN